uniref:Uncharacterized protein n=1 Tax=Arundo donax TaxID=35708 RepID=A0A0A9UFK9_ARUDO
MAIKLPRNTSAKLIIVGLLML